MPPDPVRGSRLRRSNVITPLNKYCCQYEHLSKNRGYGPESSVQGLGFFVSYQQFLAICQLSVNPIQIDPLR